MDKKRVHFGKLLTSYLIYLLTAYFITVVSLIVLSFAVFKAEINEKIVQGIILAIYGISTFLTAKLARKMKDARWVAWNVAISTGYFAVLCIISVMINHSISPVSNDFITTYILCLGCGMLGGILK